MSQQRATRSNLRLGLSVSIVLASILTAFAVSSDATDRLLMNTVVLALLTMAFSLPVGTVLAILVYGSDLPGRRFLRALLLAMLFMPAYLQVAGWNAGFGQQGWFSRQVLLSEAVAPLEGWRGAVFLHSVVAIPWVTLIVGSGLSRIPRHLAEQASLDARPWQVLIYITLPLSLPSLIAAAMWVFVTTGSEITITDVYQVRTFAEEIYTGFALGDDIGAAQVRALPSILLVAGLCGAALVACSTMFSTISPHRLTPEWSIQWRRWKWLAVSIATLIVVLLVAIPVGNLLYKAGIQVEQTGSERLRHWNVVKCLNIVASSPQIYAEEFGWSTALGQLTAVTVVAVAVPLAWLSRRHQWATFFGWTFAILGLAIPGPIIALSLGRLFNRPESDWLFYFYDRTLVLPWLALSLRSFPYAFLVSSFAIRRVPTRLLEAAALDGASGWGQLRHVVLPQIGAMIAGAWVIAFAIAVGDLSTSILAVPPGVTTVAIRIFNLVHYGVEDQLAGLCLITMVGFALIAAAGVWLSQTNSDE